MKNPQTYIQVEIIKRQNGFKRPYIDLDRRAQIFAYQNGHHRRKTHQQLMAEEGSSMVLLFDVRIECY